MALTSKPSSSLRNHESHEDSIALASIKLEEICIDEAKKELHEDTNDRINDDDDDEVSPFDSSSWISVLFLSMLTPLLRLGYSRPLQPQDIPTLPSKDSITECSNSFQQAWKQRQEQGDTNFLRAALNVYHHSP